MQRFITSFFSSSLLLSCGAAQKINTQTKSIAGPGQTSMSNVVVWFDESSNHYYKAQCRDLGLDLEENCTLIKTIEKNSFEKNLDVYYSRFLEELKVKRDGHAEAVAKRSEEGRILVYALRDIPQELDYLDKQIKTLTERIPISEQNLEKTRENYIGLEAQLSIVEERLEKDPENQELLDTKTSILRDIEIVDKEISLAISALEKAKQDLEDLKEKKLAKQERLEERKQELQELILKKIEASKICQNYTKEMDKLLAEKEEVKKLQRLVEDTEIMYRSENFTESQQSAFNVLKANYNVSQKKKKYFGKRITANRLIVSTGWTMSDPITLPISLSSNDRIEAVDGRITYSCSKDRTFVKNMTLKLDLPGSGDPFSLSTKDTLDSKLSKLYHYRFATIGPYANDLITQRVGKQANGTWEFTFKLVHEGSCKINEIEINYW